MICAFWLISSSVGTSGIVSRVSERSSSWMLARATDGLLQLRELLMGVIHFDLLLELEVDHLFEFLLDGGVVSSLKADSRDVLGELVVELTFMTTVLEV